MVPDAWSEAGARFGEDGLLYLGEWRRGFDVHELRALFWECQRVRALESELRAAAACTACLQATIEALEGKVYWYRRQLVAESRLGLALARIATD